MITNADSWGPCGDGVSYEFIQETGILTISKTGEGSGKMQDFLASYAGYGVEKTDILKIVIEEGVTSIGQRAFMYCSNLNSITLANSVTKIDNWAFCGCTSLTSVTIPNSVTDAGIGNGVFEDCTSLTSIVLPESLTHISQSLFSNCSSLASIKIPKSVTAIGQLAFSNCTSLTIVDIPQGVNSMGQSVFSGCTNLVSIYIPDSTRWIMGTMFTNCSSLRTVYIHEGVSVIDDHAFHGCSSLSDVFCYSESVPQTKDNAFSESSISSATLHIKQSFMDSYKTTYPWSEFKEYVALPEPYTLIYIIDGEVYKTYNLMEGESITPEPAPTKEGCTFSGWSWIPSKMPAENVTVTGSFIPNNYKLIYIVDGEVYMSSEVAYDSPITPEAEPNKEGYIFSGWSYIPSKMPAEDVTVTGSFTINKYTLTYMIDDEVWNMTIMQLSFQSNNLKVIILVLNG